MLVFLQTFNDGASLLRKCSVERLESILSPDEARHNRLIESSYKNAVHEFCNEGQSGDKIMIVAFEKDSSDPSGLILLKKKSYDACKLTSLAGHEMPRDMTTTTRKLMWEVSYCVRRGDKHSLCLGDILLSCAIQEVRNRAAQDSHGASTYIWLVLAGGFANLPALRLYLAHGFEIIGFYEAESEVLMAVRNVDDNSTRRALKQVTGKVESTFLLPALKNATAMQPPIVRIAPSEDVQDRQSTEASGMVWIAPSNEDIQDSQSTEASGVVRVAPFEDVQDRQSREASGVEWMVPFHEDTQDSQITEASGMNLFSQESSVAVGKSADESEFQGAHSSSELDIEMESPQKDPGRPVSALRSF